MKHDTTQADSTGSGIDTTAFNGLNDTTNNSTTAANSSTQNSSAANNGVASTGTTSAANTDAGTVTSSSSTGKTMVRDVEKSSNAKYSNRQRVASYSIYDGINDQEERYVVRKAEGYNDAYYIDDYNGSNKFYEEHYKKASKLEKPEAEYIDKSINLPTSAYASGPTQKTADSQLPKIADDAPKSAPEKVEGSTGTIGISKKSLIEQSKKAKEKK